MSVDSEIPFFENDDEIDAWIDDKKKAKKQRVITAVEMDPMNKLNNLTQLNNLQYLHPISEHLWWLSLMAKISLVYMIITLTILFLTYSKIP